MPHLQITEYSCMHVKQSYKVLKSNSLTLCFEDALRVHVFSCPLPPVNNNKLCSLMEYAWFE